MRIENKFDLNKIKSYIIQKAKYQKVIICIDESSDIDIVEKIIKAVDKNVVVLKYIYNDKTIKYFKSMLNDGVRVVIYNVTSEHFSKLDEDDVYILKVFIPTSKFVLPFMVRRDCVYGDNILICDDSKPDYIGITSLYYSGLNNAWSCIQSGQQIDLNSFKAIESMINQSAGFHSKMLECVYMLKPSIDNDFEVCTEAEIPYRIYLKLCAILNMLEKLNINCETYIDFYKHEKSYEQIIKAYQLIVKADLITLLKYNCENLIRLNNLILNRIKILIKKYFNIKNINLNKINNDIKNRAKYLKIDNLLYISHILNSI